MTASPDIPPGDEPSPDELLIAAEAALHEAIQDYTRVYHAVSPHPAFLEQESPENPSVLVGWVVLFDCHHADSSRSIGSTASEGMQDWISLGMMEYAKQRMQGETTVDMIVDELSVDRRDDDD